MRYGCSFVWLGFSRELWAVSSLVSPRDGLLLCLSLFRLVFVVVHLYVVYFAVPGSSFFKPSRDLCVLPSTSFTYVSFTNLVMFVSEVCVREVIKLINETKERNCTLMVHALSTNVMLCLSNICLRWVIAFWQFLFRTQDRICLLVTYVCNRPVAWGHEGGIPSNFAP